MEQIGYQGRQGPPVQLPPQHPQGGGENPRVESAATQALSQLPASFQAPSPSKLSRLKEKVATIWERFAESKFATYAALGAVTLAAIGLIAGAIWLMNQPFTQRLVQLVEQYAKVTVLVLTPGLIVTMLK
jgi:hypothetical protein